MPAYEYKCPNCGIFTVKQRITEPHLKSCPTCGAEVKRLISKNIGIVYKAGGFYCVDNRKDKKAEEESKENKESLKGEKVGNF